MWNGSKGVVSSVGFAVGFAVGMSLAASGCVLDAGTDGDDDGGGGAWDVISLPAGQESNNVLAVHCASNTQCVFGTSPDSSGDPGALFALRGAEVGDKLLDGASGDLMQAASVLGDLAFIGLERTRDGVLARLDASGAMVTATGDLTQRASWNVEPMGTIDGAPLPLNAQTQLRDDGDGAWIFINQQGYVHSATARPSRGTAWTKIWGPTATPPVPADFVQRHAQDPSLCHADVSAGGLPAPSNPNWVAPDLSVIVLPAGGLNARGSAEPGVCISTDRGRTFYNVPFDGVPDTESPGPKGVTCLDKDRCFAFNGLPFQTGTAYIRFTLNASAGKASTWTAATVPSGWASSNAITLQMMFFAPDGVHGWVVGNDNHRALLARTTDGGRTWIDASASVRGASEHDLYAGFALDKDRVWLGGRFGTLLATTQAQR